MDEKNFEQLKDTLRYLGFGEVPNEALSSKLQDELPAFSITHKTEINRKPFEATLNFKRSIPCGPYFLKSYLASLSRANGEKIDHSFYLTKGKGVTAKEAYNLLEGRSVYKELSKKTGERYHAWLQIDFEKKDNNGNYEMKQFHEHYGYDLKAAVSKFAVIELKDPEKESALLHSLQKGNVQSATIEKDGFIHKIFLEANPQYKTVNVYDADLKRVQKEQLGKYQSVSTSSETRKEEASQKEDLSTGTKKAVHREGKGRRKGR